MESSPSRGGGIISMPRGRAGRALPHQLLPLEANEPQQQCGHRGQQVLHQGDGAARLQRLLVGHLADLQHQPPVCERSSVGEASGASGGGTEEGRRARGRQAGDVCEGRGGMSEVTPSKAIPSPEMRSPKVASSRSFSHTHSAALLSDHKSSISTPIAT